VRFDLKASLPRDTADDAVDVTALKLDDLMAGATDDEVPVVNGGQGVAVAAGGAMNPPGDPQRFEQVKRTVDRH
jgi:hypothetical protein